MAVEPCTPTTSNEKERKKTPDSSVKAKLSGTSNAVTAPLSVVKVPLSPQLRNYSHIIGTEQQFEEGYDSDGEKGPFTNVYDVEGEKNFDKAPLLEDMDGNKAPTMTAKGVGSLMSPMPIYSSSNHLKR